MSRFPAIPDGELTEAQRQVVEAIASGPRGGVRGPFIPLLRSPEMAARIAQVGEYLRFGSVLPQALVELAILVTARATGAPYEWQAHHPLALKAGLPEAVAEAVGRGEPPTGAEEVVAVHDYAHELTHNHAVSDPVFARVQSLFGPQGTIELTAVCGYYTMIAFVLNASQVALPEGRTAPFPAAAPG